jgi:hypothetical protein
MADIQNNSGDGSNSAMTAIVAILVIVVIGLIVWFGFLRGNAGAPADNGGGINVELNAPGGSGSGGASGAGY